MTEKSEKNVPAKTESTWSPIPFGSMRDEMNRLFGDFLGSRWPDWPLSADRTARPQMLSPRVDIAETDGAFEISAELPGIDEKDVDVSVADGVLTIQGEKKAEHEKKEKDYHQIERSYGSFQRSLTLPSTIDIEKIAASFDNGVLKIELPKTEEAKPEVTKVKVKSKK